MTPSAFLVFLDHVLYSLKSGTLSKPCTFTTIHRPSRLNMSGQPFVTVHALTAGHLTLPEKFFVTPSHPTRRKTVPSLAFLIQHKSANSDKVTRIVFDLGIRRDVNSYSEPIRKHCENRQPMDTMPDVVESLKEGGLDVSDIDFVILSHVHWDHIGMPSDFTDKKTHFIIGPGAQDLLDGKNVAKVGSHAHFEKDLLPLDQTIQLPPTNDTPNSIAGPNAGLVNPVKVVGDDFMGDKKPPTTNAAEVKKKLSPQQMLWSATWKSLGAAVPHAIDFFSDGSLYIVDAPGHLPGHINALARTGKGYVYLAGDACHDIRLFTGECEIATWTDDAGNACCIHVDKPMAEETIKRIRALHEGKDARFGEVEVCFAHNSDWETDAKKRNRFWPGSL